mmetsp:Transcript_68772/g.174758  ORF Transcript_68772/g.174758 Transcript_68772/m.174758 type:complete len:242 (-) Transcript_68772:92-817(-)
MLQSCVRNRCTLRTLVGCLHGTRHLVLDGRQGGVQEPCVQCCRQPHAHRPGILVQLESLRDCVFGQPEHGLDGERVERRLHRHAPVLTNCLCKLAHHKQLSGIQIMAHHTVHQSDVWRPLQPSAVELHDLSRLGLHLAHHGCRHKPTGNLTVLQLHAEVVEQVHGLQSPIEVASVSGNLQDPKKIGRANLAVVNRPHVAELHLEFVEESLRRIGGSPTFHIHLTDCDSSATNFADPPPGNI